MPGHLTTNLDSILQASRNSHAGPLDGITPIFGLQQINQHVRFIDGPLLRDLIDWVAEVERRHHLHHRVWQGALALVVVVVFLLLIRRGSQVRVQRQSCGLAGFPQAF